MPYSRHIYQGKALIDLDRLVIVNENKKHETNKKNE